MQTIPRQLAALLAQTESTVPLHLPTDPFRVCGEPVRLLNLSDAAALAPSVATSQPVGLQERPVLLVGRPLFSAQKRGKLVRAFHHVPSQV